MAVRLQETVDSVNTFVPKSAMLDVPWAEVKIHAMNRNERRRLYVCWRNLNAASKREGIEVVENKYTREFFCGSGVLLADSEYTVQYRSPSPGAFSVSVLTRSDVLEQRREYILNLMPEMDKIMKGVPPQIRGIQNVIDYYTIPEEMFDWYDMDEFANDFDDSLVNFGEIAYFEVGPRRFDDINEALMYCYQKGWNLRKVKIKESYEGLRGGNPGKKNRYKKKKNPSEGRRQRSNKRRQMNTVKQEGSINVVAPRNRTYPALIRYTGSLVSDASGVVTARFSIRNPSMAFNGSGTYNDVLDYAATFDQYKPVYWIMQYVPLFPVGSVAGGSLVMCTDYDNDDTQPTPNYSNIMQYREFKILDSRKPFEYKARIPVLTEGTYSQSGADPEPAVIHKGGFLDYNKPPNEGMVYMGGLGLPPMSTFGTFVLTMLIINRDPR